LNQKDALKGNMKNLFDQITVDEISSDSINSGD